METIALIDYGCHSFTFRLVAHLRQQGYAFRYLANGSLESPNLSSLKQWKANYPDLVRVISCAKSYGKMSLKDRLQGEIEWTGHCLAQLEIESPSVIVVSCLPLTVVQRIQTWARRRDIPMVYWLQDLQGTAIAELLGKRLGAPGKLLGYLAKKLEQKILERSRHIITIAREHEQFLPAAIRREQRVTSLENWANIEDVPVLPTANDWSARHDLDRTLNIVYSGTLGFKHDLGVFPALAAAFRDRPDVRVVVVSSGAPADHLRAEATREGLDNLLVLPFQPYEDVPKVLASAAVLIAPLDPSAGSFCVPSKVLSYLCSGRSIVLAIDRENPAARMIAEAQAGFVVCPGDTAEFVGIVRTLIEDRVLRDTQGENARRHAELTFNIDHVVSRFLAIFDSAGLPLVGGSLQEHAWPKSISAA